MVTPDRPAATDGRSDDSEQTRQLAVALLRRIEAALRLPRQPAQMVDAPLVGVNAATFDGHPLDSLDILEAMVVIQGEIGVSLLDRTDLAEAQTLHGLAAIARCRGNHAAVAAFSERWSTAGDYLP